MENPEFLTFPVTVKAVRADWLLDDSSGVGLEFLRDLGKVNDKGIFESEYVSIVIQFLYSRFRDKIVRTKLPLYVIHLISVLLASITHERLRA